VDDDVEARVSEVTSGTPATENAGGGAGRQAPTPGEPNVRRRWKTILAIVVGVLAVVWLGLFLTVGGSFYKTVDEAKAVTPGQAVRVGGMVTEGSIQQNGDKVAFTIENGSGSTMPVVYTGAYPSRLGPFEQVVVAGTLNASGTVEATEVLIKCPDKLFPEKVTNGVLSGVGLKKLLY
jgi:cytochrome c-type biogenesis protein CcmE